VRLALLTVGLPGEEECCDAKIKSATSAMIPIMSIGLEAFLPRNSDFPRFLDVAVLAAGDDCGGGEGGRDGGKVEAFGTVTAALQFGHGAVTPIWAGVAEMC
jgi:hypothetical protein